MEKLKKGIVSLLASHPRAKHIGLTPRQSMQEELKSLYSHEYLDGLHDDQIIDLWEEKILLPGLQHIKLQKPVKPRPGTNIYDLPIDDEWWLHPSLIEPEDEA